MKLLLAVQHTPVETLGTLGDALRVMGVPYEYVRIQEREPVPESAKGFRGLVVLGGPMGVYETDSPPHLEDELRLIWTRWSAGYSSWAFAWVASSGLELWAPR